MADALKAVKTGMPVYAASTHFNVPRSTLRRYIGKETW